MLMSLDLINMLFVAIHKKIKKIYIYIFICGIYNHVCGMMHIKEALLLIGMSRPCGSSGFPLLLSDPLPNV